MKLLLSSSLVKVVPVPVPVPVPVAVASWTFKTSLVQSYTCNPKQCILQNYAYRFKHYKYSNFNSTGKPNHYKVKATSTSSYSSFQQFVQSKLVPSLKRLPLFIILFYVLQEESISPMPIVIDRLYGPSMMPTIYTHDIYLRYRSLPPWLLSNIHNVFNLLSIIGLRTGTCDDEPNRKQSISYSKGDLVILQDYKGTYACKRIIGIENDQVLKYGQYAPILYSKESDYGIPNIHGIQKHGIDITPPSWEEHLEQVIIYDDSDIDNNNSNNNNIENHKAQSQRNDNGNKTHVNPILYTKIIIPKGFVWVEGDNPLDSIDSRHYGPVSLDNLHGKIIYRLWPRTRVQRISHFQNKNENDDGDDHDHRHNDKKYVSCYVSKHRPKPLSEAELKELLK